MKALFGAGLHPNAEQITAHAVEAGLSRRHAESIAQLGRRYPDFKPLPDREQRIAARLAALRRRRTSRGSAARKRPRNAVQSQDMTWCSRR
jgi:hypothetical protein